MRNEVIKMKKSVKNVFPIYDDHRWSVHSFFFFIIILVAVLTLLQWIYLVHDREKRFIANQIEHYGEVIIPTWEPGKNLVSLSHFVLPQRNTSKNVGVKVCPRSSIPQILFVVCSPVQNFNYRVAIRQTWGRDSTQKYNVSVAFLVGQSQSEDTNKRILNENHLYEDLIVEDFVDSKYNNTLKSIFMLKWSVHNCPSAQFLMKSTDDAFINLDNLIKFVNDPLRIKRRLLVGKLMPTPTVDRNSLKDSYMPKYMYPYETYPDYLFGAGYLMTMETAELLYEKALLTSYIYLEDVFITGLCAEAAGITRYYDFRFYFIEYGTNRMDCSIIYQRKLIVHSHTVDIVTMYQDYNELNKCLALTEETFL